MRMSEKKEDWKKEIRTIVSTELDKRDKNLLEAMKKVSPPSSPEPKDKRTPEQITKDNVDHVMDCPSCYPKVKDRVIEREFKDADYQCVECGLPVKGEESGKEDWKCPGPDCESNQARPKD